MSYEFAKNVLTWNLIGGPVSVGVGAQIALAILLGLSVIGARARLDAAISAAVIGSFIWPNPVGGILAHLGLVLFVIALVRSYRQRRRERARQEAWERFHAGFRPRSAKP